MEPIKYSGAWNFGPQSESAQTVSWILNKMTEKIPNAKWEVDKKFQPHEATLLMLESNKAETLLSWIPRWNLDEAIDKTILWQHSFNEGKDSRNISLSQISDYMKADSCDF
jgi:CDP-glucose 4,6-dehydratase